MIYIPAKHHQLILNILARYPYDFYAFGSRVKGTHKPRSDLDLCVKVEIPLAELAKIEEEFNVSDLPFKVDIIMWSTCSLSFQQNISPDLILLGPAALINI